MFINALTTIHTDKGKNNVQKSDDDRGTPRCCTGAAARGCGVLERRLVNGDDRHDEPDRLNLGVGFEGGDRVADHHRVYQPLTGEGASQDGTSPAGFTARIDMQNAEGGIDGHKLVGMIIDDADQPVPDQDRRAECRLQSALGIVSQSPLFFLAAKYPNQAGEPVTGSYDDGPEWGTQPYTNMFASDTGSVDPNYPVNTQIGNFLKAHGGTVLGSYGYSISPIVQSCRHRHRKSFNHAGGKAGCSTPPFPSAAWTSPAAALAAKQQNINAMVPAMDNDSNYALATALKQAGVKLKAAVFPTGYQPDVDRLPGVEQIAGDYFLSLVPALLPAQCRHRADAGGVAEVRPLHLRPNSRPSSPVRGVGGGRPDDQGTAAGRPEPDPVGSHQRKLRGITSYNANGLLPVTLDYSTNFGKNPPQTCAWIMKAEKTEFSLVSPTPTCGTDLPHTSTASSLPSGTRTDGGREQDRLTIAPPVSPDSRHRP